MVNEAQKKKRQLDHEHTETQMAQVCDLENSLSHVYIVEFFSRLSFVIVAHLRTIILADL
jgi:hypothetical protein